MSTQLIPDEDFLVTVLATSLPRISNDYGNPVVSDDDLSGLVIDNNDIITVVNNGGTCFPEDSSQIDQIKTLEELKEALCELLLRFDTCPRYYSKDDYHFLTKMLSETLVYLYLQDATIKNLGSSVPFIGLATVNTNPPQDATALGHKFPGIYLLETAGVYVHFGLTIADKDVQKSVVYAVPTITDGEFIEYTSLVYSINLDDYYTKEEVNALLGTTYTEITYADLMIKITNETLSTGGRYLISDYQTIHTIPNTIDLNVGSIEPILVTALSTSKLEPIAYSSLYPQDILYYDIENNQEIVPGCEKGYIYRRIDTKQNNDIPFDFRNVKFRRWQLSVLPEDVDGAGANYLKNAVIKETGTNNLYIKLDDIEAVSFTNTNSWRLFKWLNLDYASPTENEWIFGESSLVITCSANYQDYNMWADPIYYDSAYSNIIAPTSTNILVNANTIIFGGDFSSNHIGNNFAMNNISESFYSNNISLDFYGNDIGWSFTCNQIGPNFIANIISLDFAYNNIGAAFMNNNIGEGFFDNNISTDFISNITGQGFQHNHTLEIFNSIGGVNFSSIEHVSQPYSKELFADTLGFQRLRYVDEFGDTIIIDFNAG